MAGAARPRLTTSWTALARSTRSCRRWRKSSWKSSTKATLSSRSWRWQLGSHCHPSTGLRARRLELLALNFPEARAWTKARWSLRLDVLDACACLWTAGRLANGSAKKVPTGKIQRDSRGLPMRICY